MFNKRTILTIIISVIIFIGQMLFSIAASALFPIKENIMPHFWHTIVVSLAAVVLFVTNALAEFRYNVRVRFVTHGVMLTLSTQVAWAFCLILPYIYALLITLGIYILIYYVFGIIQIPIYKFDRKLGIKPSFALFYPFKDKFQTAGLVFNAVKFLDKKVHFDFEDGYSEIIGEFFFIDINRYGNVCLDKTYLVTEFGVEKWNNEDFDAYATAMCKYGFDAVGYSLYKRQSGVTIKLITVPHMAKYEKGRAFMDEYFEKLGIKPIITVHRYEDFQTDVITKLAPIEDFFTVDIGAEISKEKLNMFSKKICYLIKEELEKAGAVGRIHVMAKFNNDAKFKGLFEIAQQLEKDGYNCYELSTREKKQDIVWLEGENPPNEELINITYGDEDNAVLFTKVVCFDKNLPAAAARVFYALHFIRMAQMEGYLESKEENRQPMFAKYMKNADRILRTVPFGEERMGGNYPFSLKDITDAKLRWVMEEKRFGWVVGNETEKIKWLFSIIQNVDRKATAIDLDEEVLADEIMELKIKLKDMGAIVLNWEISD